MEILRQVLSVFLVFAVLGIALWALRRGGMVSLRAALDRRRTKDAKPLQAVDRLTLSPQHSLHLIQIEGRRIIVATHPQGCTILEGGA